MNVANALTVLRLVLVPVFIGLLVAGEPGSRAAAFVAFGVASVTDLLDGELARRRNLITDFGKIADPIADKALTGSALVTLSFLGELAWWVTVVILVRELAVTALRFWVIRRGVIAASRGGKLKTLLQVIAISLYILPWHVWVARQIFMGAAVVVTVVTGVDYTVRAIRLHRAVPGQPPGARPDPPVGQDGQPAPDARDAAGPAAAGREAAGPDSGASEVAGSDSAASELAAGRATMSGDAAGPARPAAGGDRS
jgi:CDP-diacylglycerol--glycerol-3-phosphate 3-phosphatidyltransferase